MTQKFEFSCGCSFPVIAEKNGRPCVQFNPQITKLPLDCQKTWDLVSEGNTKGVFQLESRFGRQSAKKLKPRSIEHLSALAAILRPGCLEAMRDGKSVTQHYIDRKNAEEEVTYFHPALKPILEETYGELIYQEQAMQIARDIAGFDLQQADVLRKAIGKKIPKLMAEVKKQFLEGCESKGIVNKEEAEEIFGWIEKSQRYSFNKSHSVSYAMNAYLTAYAKAHFPRIFFTGYLYHAGDKKQNPQQEIKELVNNAQAMMIDVSPPDIRCLNPHFTMRDKRIVFGLLDIKGIGDSQITKIITRAKEVEDEFGKPIGEWNWMEFLVFYSRHLSTAVVRALVQSGSLAYMQVDRTKMLFEYELYARLTNKEQSWVTQNIKAQEITSLKGLFSYILERPTGRGQACSTKTRHTKITSFLDLLNKPPNSLMDSNEWIASIEEKLLGISLTTSHVDSRDISAANCTCQEYTNGYTNHDNIIIIGCEVTEVKPTKTKKGKYPGKNMAFLSVRDSFGVLDNIVAFPETWKEYQHLLMPTNTVLLSGERGKEDTFILQKVWQI